MGFIEQDRGTFKHFAQLNTEYLLIFGSGSGHDIACLGGNVQDEVQEGKRRSDIVPACLCFELGRPQTIFLSALEKPEGAA